MQIHANAGFTVRLGRNISGFPLLSNRNNMAPGADRGPRPQWEYWIFAGVDGRAIARNLFLDGSTFKDSHSVDREDFVADLRLGFSIRRRSLRVTYTQVERSRELAIAPAGAEDGGRHSFGSLSLTWEKALQ